MGTTSDINVLTRDIIGAHIEVHRELGPKLLESIYATCVHRELQARGLHFERERPIPIVYKGDTLPSFYRIDLIVEGLIVVELKAVTTLVSEHEAQLFNYMRIARQPVGYLINFGTKDELQWKRFVLTGRLISDKGTEH